MELGVSLDELYASVVTGRLGMGLCCKNNSVGETEPTANLIGRLFSFQSEDFPDELNLTKDVPFRQPPHLAFPDHVHNLIALNRSPGTLERSKTLAGVHPSLDCSMGPGLVEEPIGRKPP